MNDKFVSLSEITNELKEIENLGASLDREIHLLTQKIKYIISQIQSSESIEDANEYFDLLDEIQLVLCGLVFKYEIGIPDHLRKFVSDFDNLEYNKKDLFLEIKKREYSF